jgi:hypothetical protein
MMIMIMMMMIMIMIIMMIIAGKIPIETRPRRRPWRRRQGSYAKTNFISIECRCCCCPCAQGWQVHSDIGNTRKTVEFTKTCSGRRNEKAQQRLCCWSVCRPVPQPNVRFVKVVDRGWPYLLRPPTALMLDYCELQNS